MRWLKIAGVCVAALVALSVVSLALKLIEWLVIAAVLVVVLVLKTRDHRRSARNTKIDAQRKRETHAHATRLRLSVEEELEQMKREMS